MKKTNKKNLYVVGLISFLNALTLGAIIPIIYNYGTSFGLNDTSIGFLFASFAFAQFFATPVIGRLSDKYGRKPLLIISLFGTFIASLIQAFAINAFMLFAGRIFDGITGGNNSVAQAVIADSTDEKDKPFGFAIFGASFGLGFLFGPVVTLLVSQDGNQYVYLFSAVLALITTLITAFILPETNQNRETKKLHIVDTLFLQILRALKMPVVRDIIILNFITALSVSIFQIAFQPYLQSNLGLGQEYISYVLILSGIINVIFVPLVKKVIDKFGLNQTLNAVFLARVICFGLLAVIIHPIIFWSMMVLFSFINLFARPVISSLLTKYGKPEDQGVILGVSESLFSLGLAIGPSIFALTAFPKEANFSFLNIDFITNILRTTSENYTLAFWVITIISIVSLLYSMRFTKYLTYFSNKGKSKIDF
jgi:MFS family permease